MVDGRKSLESVHEERRSILNGVEGAEGHEVVVVGEAGDGGGDIVLDGDAP